MADIHFKYEDQAEWVNILYSTAFVIDKRNAHVTYCEEYDIIKKIQKNEDGFFDFSKNLIDVGAEDGNYAMLLDFQHNYCFEPNKKACCLLYANMYLKDKVDKTDVYTLGLSDKNGETIFDGFVCEPTKDTPRVKNDTYNIPIKTMDSFGFENVGLIKVDVEGYEENVLRGGIGTIIRNDFPPILFECWDEGKFGMTHEKHESLFNFLIKLDYIIIQYWGDQWTHLAVHKSHITDFQREQLKKYRHE